MFSSLHYPLTCRCGSQDWKFHTSYVECNQCHFIEHFAPQEVLLQVLERMKMQGCYFLDSDKGKCDNRPAVEVGSYRYR